MYAAFDDPYCYPGTGVLRNKLGITNAARLEAFEEEVTKQRAAQPLPSGQLSVSHYRAIHRHLFQDVFVWAGRFRTVRIGKSGSVFAYPEHLTSGMRKLFAELHRENRLRGLAAGAFATKAAHVVAELNALHAFRDGNGRTQVIFLALMADRAGHPIEFDRIEPDAFLTAMIHSFRGDEEALAAQIGSLLT